MKAHGAEWIKKASRDAPGSTLLSCPPQYLIISRFPNHNLAIKYMIHNGQRVRKYPYGRHFWCNADGSPSDDVLVSESRIALENSWGPGLVNKCRT